MRKAKNNKGQMRVIEVILASIIIMSALSFLTIFSATPKTSELEVADLEKTGYSLLLDLDNQGLLAPMVYENRWGDLRTVLKIAIPADVYFNLTVYNANRNEMENTLALTLDRISNVVYGDEETFAFSKNVASVSYLLSGYPSGTPGSIIARYDPMILVLQLTRG
jgi:hypothetical protein